MGNQYRILKIYNRGAGDHEWLLQVKVKFLIWEWWWIVGDTFSMSTYSSWIDRYKCETIIDDSDI